MSDIVSVGIQAGGFDSAVSDVLSEETFNHLLVLLCSCDEMFIIRKKGILPNKLSKKI